MIEKIYSVCRVRICVHQLKRKRRMNGSRAVHTLPHMIGNYVYIFDCIWQYMCIESYWNCFFHSFFISRLSAWFELYEEIVFDFNQNEMGDKWKSVIRTNRWQQHEAELCMGRERQRERERRGRTRAMALVCQWTMSSIIARSAQNSTTITKEYIIYNGRGA